jgi:hypothetical protein|tara:strand:- start:239 stop:358 length:120 start_codon:yes stop_codon:yes gene_type:complete
MGIYNIKSRLARDIFLVYKKDLFSHLLFALWEFYPGEHK